jgi:hypothetical protein
MGAIAVEIPWTPGIEAAPSVVAELRARTAHGVTHMANSILSIDPRLATGLESEFQSPAENRRALTPFPRGEYFTTKPGITIYGHAREMIHSSSDGDLASRIKNKALNERRAA